jgi:hypothetical protein
MFNDKGGWWLLGGGAAVLLFFWWRARRESDKPQPDRGDVSTGPHAPTQQIVDRGGAPPAEEPVRLAVEPPAPRMEIALEKPWWEKLGMPKPGVQTNGTDV